MFSRRLKTGYFVLEGLNSFATVYYFYYFYFYMQKVYGFDNKANLALAALNGGTYAALAWGGGKFAQHFGYFTALKLGFASMLAALAIGSQLHTAAGQILMMILTIFGMSFTWPTLEALVSEGEPRQGLQHMVGIYNVVWAGTAALANFFGGAMLEAFGFQSLFYVPMAIQLTQLGLTVWLGSQARQSIAAAVLPRSQQEDLAGTIQKHTEANEGNKAPAGAENAFPIHEGGPPQGEPSQKGSPALNSPSPSFPLLPSVQMNRSGSEAVAASVSEPDELGRAGLSQRATTDRHLSTAGGRPAGQALLTPPSSVPSSAVAHPSPPARAKQFVRMAWLANPFAYVALNTVIAAMPGVAHRLALSTMLAGFCGSVWCFARFGAFFGLWVWAGWHYRFRWLLLAYAALVGTFTTILLAPNVAIFVLAQTLFGLALGLIYYSSLFYSMDISDTKGEHGGIHEAAIGLGNCAGPAVGAATLQLLPQYSNSGPLAVTLLLLGGLGGLLTIWRRRKSPG